MATAVTITELRTMSANDIRKEVAEKRIGIAKMKMGITMKSDKDTSKLRFEKRQLARMLTILGEMEKTGEAQPKAKKLKSPAKSSKVPTSVPQRGTTAGKSASAA